MSLHPGLQVSKMAWLKRKLPAGKTHSAVILSTTNPETANQVIAKGIICNYSLHTAEYYSPLFTVTQCFKCQAYGHIASHCRKEAKCGKCAGSHNTRECTKEETQCANCNQKHNAWSNSCPTRRANQARANSARLTNPGGYRERTQPQQQIQEGWTLARSKKRIRTEESQKEEPKRGPGRPRDLSRPPPPGQMIFSGMGLRSSQYAPETNLEEVVLSTQASSTPPTQPDTDMGDNQC